jgi:hypothetical protein
MSVRIAVSSAVLLLSVAACATGPRDRLPTYGQDLQRLTTECSGRGGILQPIPGAATGQPQTDYACVIRGGASRLN